MQNRVKNLEKLTKEIVTQISAWEETNGPFMYGVSFIQLLFLRPECSNYPSFSFNRESDILKESHVKRSSILK